MMRENLREANVVMLPTEKADRAILKDKYGKLSYFSGYMTQEYLKNELDKTSHYLYFTTDEEIKEGDWYLYLNPNGNASSKQPFRFGLSTEKSNYNKKIVATTNPDLIPYPVMGEHNAMGRIPTDFLEAYVREQDKIIEVMLEYERYKLSNSGNTAAILEDGHHGDLYRLKLRSNGTVIIHPVIETAEEAWNKIENKDQFVQFTRGGHKMWAPFELFQAGWNARDRRNK